MMLGDRDKLIKHYDIYEGLIPQNSDALNLCFI
jgi:hypothetical protein